MSSGGGGKDEKKYPPPSLKKRLETRWGKTIRADVRLENQAKQIQDNLNELKHLHDRCDDCCCDVHDSLLLLFACS